MLAFIKSVSTKALMKANIVLLASLSILLSTYLTSRKRLSTCVSSMAPKEIPDRHNAFKSAKDFFHSCSCRETRTRFSKTLKIASYSVACSNFFSNPYSKWSISNIPRSKPCFSKYSVTLIPNHVLSKTCWTHTSRKVKRYRKDSPEKCIVLMLEAHSKIRTILLD